MPYIWVSTDKFEQNKGIFSELGASLSYDGSKFLNVSNGSQKYYKKALDEALNLVGLNYEKPLFIINPLIYNDNYDEAYTSIGAEVSLLNGEGEIVRQVESGVKSQIRKPYPNKLFSQLVGKFGKKTFKGGLAFQFEDALEFISITQVRIRWTLSNKVESDTFKKIYEEIINVEFLPAFGQPLFYCLESVQAGTGKQTGTNENEEPTILHELTDEQLIIRRQKYVQLLPDDNFI
ncbi:hypothetical protein WOSG25_110630 [Weissella oryzae SG25]|uniref:Uncharacterized protein n=1 Tax=Weissella oryzae (strain DSM 25784 / JCM 18191 / LMG 30913 / SG25) TaxID=1329250 RepID=A0A069CUU7_WEIOS|nr:hypothetical protein [Weissella oryzae]GAK31585.1 hypothetical protein WOSG25_110630 [Weissella oryzae SG25]